MVEGAEILTKFTADTSEMDKATESTSKSIDKLQVLGVAAFTAMTAAVDKFVIGLMKSGIEYNAQMQTFATRLKTLTGTTEEADKVLQQIKQDALTTPFDVASLTQAESLLLSTGLSAEEARQDILALGDAVSATGGGNAELQRMAVNLQQIKNVGKASALDIKQFAYAGIDIYGILADSLGVTREEASKLDVTYEMLSGALQNASAEGGKYYNAMTEQSKTYNGAMSNLTESFEVFKGELAQGLFVALEGLIPKLTDLFDWLTKNKDVIIAIGGPILTALNLFLGWLAITKVTSVLSLLWGVMIANPIGLVIAAIGAIVVAFINLWNNCEDFRQFWIGLWEGIKSVFTLGVAKIQAGINAIKNAFNKLKEWVSSIWKSIKNIFSNMGTKMADVGSNIAKGLWNGLSKMKDWVINKVKDMGKSILKGLKKVLGIASPSKEFAIVGKFSAKGYIEGIDGMQKEIDKSINATFNPFSGGSFNGMTTPSPTSNITIQNSMNYDALGQLVNNVKTFSGGAKNDYNYVGGY